MINKKKKNGYFGIVCTVLKYDSHSITFETVSFFSDTYLWIVKEKIQQLIVSFL